MGETGPTSRGEFSRSETRLEYVFYRTAWLRRIPRNASFLNSRTPCLCFFFITRCIFGNANKTANRVCFKCISYELKMH